MKGEMIAENPERRFRSGKMDAVIAPQTRLPGQIGGAANQGLGHVRYFVRRPLDFEIPAQGREQPILPWAIKEPLRPRSCICVTTISGTARRMELSAGSA